MRSWLIILILIIISCVEVFSQDVITDSLNVNIKDKSLKNDHSPSLASALSAVLPGAGQVYNRKYWKVPIVYAGIGAGVYFFTKNYQNYQLYKDSYIARQFGDTLSNSTIGFGTLELKSRVQDAHKYYELAIVGTLVVYVLNIVDASVDGHLFNFDVSEDLSMKLEPKIESLSFYKPSYGVSMKFNF